LNFGDRKYSFAIFMAQLTHLSYIHMLVKNQLKDA